MFFHRPCATNFPRLIAVLGACQKCVLDHLWMHFSSRFVHNFSCAPGKKKNFLFSERTILTKMKLPCFFLCCLCCLKSSCSFFGMPAWCRNQFCFLFVCWSKAPMYFSQRKKGVYLMKEILKIFFSIRKETFHFCPISVCCALILQLFKRRPGNNYCRHVAGILMIIGKPPGLVGDEEPVCQAKKYCRRF